MKYSLIVCCFILFSFSVHAQHSPALKTAGRISAKVIDSLSGRPVEFASVSVFADTASKPVNGAMTNSKGVFIIENLPPGTYRINISSLGYRAKAGSGIIISTDKPSVKLRDILLANNAVALHGVTVIAQRDLVQYKIDKMVYDASKDVTTQGGVATDVLQKVPGVSVDVDGNIELQGSGSVRVLINGKPSSIFGTNLAEALQSIPASQIKSVEVITIPGAKYDAAGGGGILNIILKDNKAKGVNGNVTVAGGTRLENGSVNLNMRKGTFGVNASFSGNLLLNSTTLNNLNRSSFDSAGGNTTLLQDGQSGFTRHGYESRLGFDWDITKKDNITASIGLDNFGNNSNGYTNQWQMTYAKDHSGGLTEDIHSLRNATNNFRFRTTDLELDYKKTFKTDGQELDFSFVSSNGRNNADYLQNQVYTSNDSLFSGAHSSNFGKDNETDVQLDYAQPLNKDMVLEFGTKGVFNEITSNVAYYGLHPASGEYFFDSSQSNNFRYRQQVYAGYADLSFKLFKLLDVKAGGRYERTALNADFTTGRETLLPGYNTIIPSVIIARTFKNKQTLKFGYTRRIERPEYRDLDPFINASDPANISVGNPNLGPEKHQRLELSYNTFLKDGGSLNITLFYRASNHDIQSYVIYYPTLLIGDTTYTNVAVTTRENVGLEQTPGISFYGTVPITSKINLRGEFNLFDKYIRSSLVPGATANSFNYRINMNATYQVTSDLVMEFFGNFRSPRTSLQGRSPSFTTYNFAFKKLIFNKKGSIGFTTTNPFGKYVDQKTNLTGKNFTLISDRKIPFRSFGISFSYQFGKMEYHKDKPDNMGQQSLDDSNN